MRTFRTQKDAATMTQTVTITMNGARRSIAKGSTLIEVLTAQGINPANVVAELNGSIVKKENFGTVTPLENDALEIVRFVGGG